MKTRTTIFILNLYTFCVGTVFMLPIIIPYYIERIGLGFREFLIAEAFFAAVVIAMEVPSGWMSDVWNRKMTLIVGSCFGIIGYSMLLFASEFWHAIVAQSIIGVGVACNSGTITSILYDTLAAKGKTDIYQRLEGKRHGTGLYAVAFGSLVGAFVYQYDIRLPVFLDVLTLFCGIIAISFIQEPPRQKRAAQAHPFRDMVVTMRYALHGHKEIAGIILVSTVLFCTTKMFLWIQQPYYMALNIPVAWFGVIAASGFVLGGLTGHFGHKYNTTFSNRFMLVVLCGAVALSGLIAAAFPSYAAIAFLLLGTIVYGYGFPFVQNAINKHADETRRATILSTAGLCVSLLFIPTSFVLGWITETTSVYAGLIYIALQLSVLSAIGFWLWGRKPKAI